MADFLSRFPPLQFTIPPEGSHLTPAEKHTIHTIEFLPIIPMGSAAGGRRGRDPLDFHTWYRYSTKRLNSAIFRVFFAIFRPFFPLTTFWERLNSAIFLFFFAIFRSFFRCPSPLRKFFCRRP